MELINCYWTNRKGIMITRSSHRIKLDFLLDSLKLLRKKYVELHTMMNIYFTVNIYMCVPYTFQSNNCPETEV